MSDLDLLSKMATPTRLGRYACKSVAGFDFEVFDWLLHVEERVLDAILDEKQRFLIINIPPRSGKSVFSGMFLPAWFLGMFPDKRALFASYADDFSSNFGRTVRTIVDRYGRELYAVQVDKQTSSATSWNMKNSIGGMTSVGVGGQITGVGFHLVVLDDIIKNTQEARSTTVKRSHVEWYDGTLRSRLEPGGTIIITATRWAEDDLSGVLIDRCKQPGYSGDQWEVISLPALAEPTDDELDGILDEKAFLETWRDELGRAKGESLNPKRFTTEMYEQIKSSIDAFTWSCLYQQRPSIPDGGMFPPSRWKYFVPGEEPDMVMKIRVWDLAATEGGGDWTVGALMGRDERGDIYIFDIDRFQRNAADVERLVAQRAAEDGYSVRILLEEERAGAGKAVVEHYRRLLSAYQVIGIRPESTKESRATPYSAMQQNQRVWLPENASWVKGWIDEHKRMMGDGRRPRHDDQIDVGAYGVNHLIKNKPATIFDPYEHFLQENEVNRLLQKHGLRM